MTYSVPSRVRRGHATETLRDHMDGVATSLPIQRIRSATLTVIVAVTAACSSTNSTTVEQHVDRLFEAHISTNAPGCAVGASRGDNVLYSNGYGIANLDYTLPITANTVFDVGSVTKQFTAASVVLLSLDGALSLDDNVRLHLPELPDHEPPITIRHLLHHTSGIRDYLNLMALSGREFYAPIRHQDIVELLARQHALNSIPGERYSYSNTGYMLLATIVERVSGQSYGTFARERIFEPLDMTQSFLYEDAERIVSNRGTGYAPGGDQGYRVVHNYSFATAGDGQLYTTVGDLLRWSHALLSNQVAGPDFGRLMLTRGTLDSGAPLDYGAGLALGAYRGLLTNGHGGSTWGFRAHLVRFPEADFTVAVLCNREDVNPRALAYDVADLYLDDRLGAADETRPTRRSRSDRPPERLSIPDEIDDYVGDFYSVELDATYHVLIDSGALQVRIGHWPALDLLGIADDTFISTDFPAWTGPRRVELTFSRDQGHTVTSLTLSAGQARNIRFVRQ